VTTTAARSPVRAIVAAAHAPWVDLTAAILVYGVCVLYTVRCVRDMPDAAAMALMPMPGVSLLRAATDFTTMWGPMTVAMMLPAVAPLLWRSRVGGRRTTALGIALGYFAVWLSVGVLVFALGRAWYYATREVQTLRDHSDVLAALVIIGAGALHASGINRRAGEAWRNRIAPACGGAGASNASLGCGISAGLCCVRCSVGPVLCQAVLGTMNPLAMIGATFVILSERVVPWHKRLSQAVGALAMLGGAWWGFASLR
jgi:predicted metal-binding membrane protein